MPDRAGYVLGGIGQTHFLVADCLMMVGFQLPFRVSSIQASTYTNSPLPEAEMPLPMYRTSALIKHAT